MRMAKELIESFEIIGNGMQTRAWGARPGPNCAWHFTPSQLRVVKPFTMTTEMKACQLSSVPPLCCHMHRKYCTALEQ